VVSNPASTYEPSADEIRAVNAMPGIQRALALYQLNLRTEANREWLWVTRDFDDQRLLAAAEIARRNNWLDRAINTADKTRELHDFSLRYPAPHRDVMQAYARERDLDEAWVYGLIRQESRFVQQARFQCRRLGSYAADADNRTVDRQAARPQAFSAESHRPD